jgi:ABC-2 type transport system ATP-binding protein
MRANRHDHREDGIVVSARDVEKTYGAAKVLKGINFEVAAGESVAILGPNGAGKTTTISVLLGLRRQTAGRVEVFGEPPLSARARQLIGVILQESGLPATVRVREALAYVSSMYENGIAPALLAERFGLEALLHRQIGALSGGKRRLLSLALAFAGSPRLVFLDEPTTGLDVEARRAVWDAIKSCSDGGTTILLTTHNLPEAEALAARAIVISEGRILADNSVGAIRASTNARQVSFTSDVVPDGIAALSRQGNRYSMVIDDPESLLRELNVRKLPYRELEVTMPSLEDAFLHIVKEAR